MCVADMVGREGGRRCSEMIFMADVVAIGRSHLTEPVFLLYLLSRP